MIKRELTVADIFTYMEIDSKQLYDMVNKHYKDKPDDYKVRIADFKNDTSKFFTVLELKLAADDLHNREQSPKIVDEETFKRFIQEITFDRITPRWEIEKRLPEFIPTYDDFLKNKICIQCSPNHKFHDPIDNTLISVCSFTRRYETYDDIDWGEYRIIYDFYQLIGDEKYYIRGVPHTKLESMKNSESKISPGVYGMSRVL